MKIWYLVVTTQQRLHEEKHFQSMINPRNQFGRRGRGSRRSNQSFHSSYVKSRQSIIPKSVGDAKLQIDEVLARWGFIDSNCVADQCFVKSIKDATEDCFNRRIILDWDPIDTSSLLKLHEPVEDALRLLLHHTLKQVTKDGMKTTFMKTKDALTERYGVHMPFPPFHPVEGGYKISRAYKDLGVGNEELHPFKRFSYEERKIKDYLFDEFSKHTEDEYPAHFIRSLCIFQAVSSNVTCVGCKEGSLLWNSSLRTDFCHLVCEECSSIYTLSSVANREKVASLFDKECHFRGSYAHYHEVKYHIKNKPKARMFFIFATRSSQDEDGLPVYVARISGAAPNLNTDSFFQDRIRIKSNVVFEPLLNRNPWFVMSIPQCIDITRFSMEVYDEYWLEQLSCSNA